jgi:hypothetical protein
MDDARRVELCRRAMVELVFLLAHQRRPKGTDRHNWTILRGLTRHALADGASPELHQDGPWRVGQKRLPRPGRGGLMFIPLVVRGDTTLMVPTAQDAEELVALLNWCGMPEFGQSQRA